MTEQQKASYVIAQAAMLNAEIAGMVAENAQRSALGYSMTYVQRDFVRLSENYGLGHNDVLSLFQS